MGSHHSRPSQSSDGNSRPSTGNQQPEDELSLEARAEFTVADIYSRVNTNRAQTLHRTDPDRFCKYRNYFKNHHMSLAKEVGRQTTKSKAVLLLWVESAVGPLEGGFRLTKDDILEIAMVSAALTEYTEAVLSKLYDQGKLDALPNVPLYTHHLRMPAKQQACRKGSDAVNKDKLEAAHYIGLEVMVRLNERLPVEQRMGDELRAILNHPTNLRLMLATHNQSLHKRVDALLIKATDRSEPQLKSSKLSAAEYDRLVQIAKHAQDHVFQDAMLQANGHHLYLSLRRQFLRMEIGDRPLLWHVEKDRRELHHPPRSRYRSPSPVRHRVHTSQSPAKKPHPTTRIGQDATDSCATRDRTHQSPFSRFAARIFRARGKKKHPVIVRAASSLVLNPDDALAPKVQGNQRGTKAQTHSKKTATAHTKAKRGKATPSTRPEKGQGALRTVSKKTAAKTVTNSIASLNSDSDSSGDDSDYVDVASDQDTSDERVVHVGPRGGKYYVNAAGKKVYIK